MEKSEYPDCCSISSLRVFVFPTHPTNRIPHTIDSVDTERNYQVMHHWEYNEQCFRSDDDVEWRREA